MMKSVTFIVLLLSITTVQLSPPLQWSSVPFQQEPFDHCPLAMQQQLWYGVAMCYPQYTLGMTPPLAQMAPQPVLGQPFNPTTPPSHDVFRHSAPPFSETGGEQYAYFPPVEPQSNPYYSSLDVQVYSDHSSPIETQQQFVAFPAEPQYVPQQQPFFSSQESTLRVLAQRHLTPFGFTVQSQSTGAPLQPPSVSQKKTPKHARNISLRTQRWRRLAEEANLVPRPTVPETPFHMPVNMPPSPAVFHEDAVAPLEERQDGLSPFSDHAISPLSSPIPLPPVLHRGTTAPPAFSGAPSPSNKRPLASIVDNLVVSPEEGTQKLCRLESKTSAMEAQEVRKTLSNPLFGCPVCSKSYETWAKLRSHERIHKLRARWSCHLCDRKFIRSSDLRAHVDKHYGIKYPCPNCGKGFASSKNVEAHEKTACVKAPKSIKAARKALNAAMRGLSAPI